MSTTPDIEAACVGCGYELRGLSESGLCPECGTPVARSLVGDRLANADPKWLARVARGQRMLSWGAQLLVVGMLLSLGVAVLLGIAMAASGYAPGAALLAIGRAVLVFGVIVGGLVLGSAGCFLVTAPDPRDADREKAFSTRGRARWGLIAAIGLIGLGEVTDFATSPIVEAISASLSLAGLLAFAVGAVSVLRWQATLCERIPAPVLAKETHGAANFLRWALPLILAWAVYGQLQPRLRTTVPVLDQILEIFGLLLGCSATIITVVLIVRTVTLLFTMSRLTRAFADMAKEAARRAGGVTETGPPLS